MTTPGLPDPYRATGSASFVEFLSALHPERLRFTPVDPAPGTRPLAPHGTTIVALRTADGVVMAGDRRATMGNIIAQRDIEKVFAADDHSVIGIAGTAGLAVELVRLFQVELEHYEKIEGVPLSLDGKANRLATLLRGNLGMAMQGLAVVPLLAGYDEAREQRADLLLRRHRRSLRGARLLRGGLRLELRARVVEEALPSGRQQ